MEVIGVGIAVIDEIHEVATYPAEDSKTRSLAKRKSRGGNVANALVVCAQLGGRCRWLGVSTDPTKDSDAAFIHSDLSAFGVDCSLAYIEAEGAMPVSFILLSRETGSRTIVHSRNLSELSFDVFVRQVTLYRAQTQNDGGNPVWFHFEGRNMDDTREMMQYIRDSIPAATISVEIEALRNEWSSAIRLASLADYVFISKDYLREKLGFQSAVEFFKAVQAKQWGEQLTAWAKAFICPWGSEGVFYLRMDERKTHHVPATRVEKVVDSVGAGDSFIGACLAGLSQGVAPFHTVLTTACEVAGLKCSRNGFSLTGKQAAWQRIFQDGEGCVGANAA